MPQKPPIKENKRNKNPNMLEGIREIAGFIGKSCPTTIRWIRNNGLPATKLPNGTWLSHKGLILQWIYAGHEAYVRSYAQYAIEQDEIEALAKKMGVDPKQVIERMREIERTNEGKQTGRG